MDPRGRLDLGRGRSSRYVPGCGVARKRPQRINTSRIEDLLEYGRQTSSRKKQQVLPQAVDSFVGSFCSQRFGVRALPLHSAYCGAGRWTTPEDALLITAVRRYGCHWYQVAELLPGRTDDQCAKRWRENLDPTIRRSPSSWPPTLLTVHPIGRDRWTEAEDLKLLGVLEKYGKRWNVISRCIKGRPAVQCRNRFLSLHRAGRVSGDGKPPEGTGTDCSNASDATVADVRVVVFRTRVGLPTNTHQQSDGCSENVATGVETQPDPLVSPATSPGSPSLPSPCPSSPYLLISADQTWDSISAASPLPSISIEGLEPARIPTGSYGASTFRPAGAVQS